MCLFRGGDDTILSAAFGSGLRKSVGNLTEHHILII